MACAGCGPTNGAGDGKGPGDGVPGLGVGDIVAGALAAVGIKPCAKCQKRKARLNRFRVGRYGVTRIDHSPSLTEPPEGLDPLPETPPSPAED